MPKCIAHGQPHMDGHFVLSLIQSFTDHVELDHFSLLSVFRVSTLRSMGGGAEILDSITILFGITRMPTFHPVMFRYDRRFNLTLMSYYWANLLGLAQTS